MFREMFWNDGAAFFIRSRIFFFFKRSYII